MNKVDQANQAYNERIKLFNAYRDLETYLMEWRSENDIRFVREELDGLISTIRLEKTIVLNKIERTKQFINSKSNNDERI